MDLRRTQLYTEIFPGLFHIPHSQGGREKQSSSYFLIRPYGNYLIYGGYTDTTLESFMESRGGVAVQYVASLDSLNASHIRLFVKFGAPAVVAPGKSAPFHKDIRLVDGPMYQYLDQKIEIFGLNGEKFSEDEGKDDHAAVYMVSLGSKKILFCNELLSISGSGVQKLSNTDQKKRLSELSNVIKNEEPDIIFTPTHGKEFLYYILTRDERERISSLLD